MGGAGETGAMATGGVQHRGWAASSSAPCWMDSAHSEWLVFFILALHFCAVGTYPKPYNIITLLYNNQVVNMKIGRYYC